MNTLDHSRPYGSGLSPLLTIDEVVAWLRMSKSTLYRAIRAGELPAVKVLGVWRIDRRDIEAMLEQGRVKARNLSHPLLPSVLDEPERSGR